MRERTMLDAIIDRLIAGQAVTVTVLEEPRWPCRHPQRAGTAGYTGGCRCPRCRTAWRAYGAAYRRGRRLPTGRQDYARRKEGTGAT